MAKQDPTGSNPQEIKVGDRVQLRAEKLWNKRKAAQQAAVVYVVESVSVMDDPKYPELAGSVWAWIVDPTGYERRQRFPLDHLRRVA